MSTNENTNAADTTAIAGAAGNNHDVGATEQVTNADADTGTNDYDTDPLAGSADDNQACAQSLHHEMCITAADMEADLLEKLERQARLFVANPDRKGDSQDNVRHFIVADFEHAWDMDRYEAYAAAEGEGACKKTRWAFHRDVAACWMVIRYDPATQTITIEEAKVIACDVMSERELVQDFFDTLNRYPDAIMITWGGENKDVAVLRRSAGEFGLKLPHHLRHSAPFSRIRLDMCLEVSGGADCVHLPEYAHATSIPCKPAPSKHIGKLVQAKQWDEVRQQALADVLTTSVIALRHLASHAVITCDMPAGYLALAEAAAAAMPQSDFVRKTFAPWAKHQVTIGKLKGMIYRAA